MEEDQELMKHVCKFCNKSFPCGRSLGGHMRSHMINSDEPVEKKPNKKKLPSTFHGGNNNGDKKKGNESCDQVGYSLRENPKKTSKFAKPSEEDTLRANKLCKECGKSFHSWKALFGHMKCHSEKVSNSTVEEEDSLNSANQKVITDDNQSDNEEAAAAPNRKKRSRRRIKRYMVAKTASSSSLTIANTSPPSVSDAEKEQNEVAMSLILLSRDVGNWGGLNSVGESSGNSSEFLEIRSSRQADQITKAKGKSEKCNGGESVKLNKLKNGKLDSAILDSEKTNFELEASGIARDGSKMKKLEVQIDGIFQDGKLSKTEMDNGDGFEGSEVEFSRNLIEESGIDQPESDTKKKTTRKRKKTDQHDPELTMDYSKKVAAKNGNFDIELYDGFEKKSKFQCTACNKTFHSYQALGGHRASHKKLKGCIASKIDSSENSTQTDQSPNQTADSKLIKCYSYDDNIVYHKSKKSSKGHECPICFRVFPSGQALGGHKRSHLIGVAKTNQSVVIQKSIPPQVRDFLDLNLPPPGEEESSEQVGGFQPRWIGRNHQHEQLVGLLSN